MQPKPFRNPDGIINAVIRICGYSSILFVTLIFLFLMGEGLPALRVASLKELFGTTWYPNEAYYGILPLIFGSVLVTMGAMLVALPFGIATAVFISEVAPRWAKEFLKSLVEILAGIPSVVLGFIGILVVVPALRRLFDLPTGLTGFTGALLLGLIAIPTVVSIAEDALNTVPVSYRHASLALGATHWQTIWGVTVPAARSGILTALMLGVGRALGETMAVMMVTGNAPVMPGGLGALFAPVRTMTATIAAEMGEVAQGSLHYNVLFGLGLILFLITFAVNWLAARLVGVSGARRNRGGLL